MVFDKTDVRIKMLRQWCEVTSCNGIIDLYESTNSKWKFAFWSTTMSVLLCAAVWFTYQTAMGYIETPTVTNIRTVTKSGIELPDIAICYNGGLNVSAMRMENLSDLLITSFSISLTNDEWSSDNVVQAKKELINYLTEKQIGVKEMLMNFSYKCEDVVLFFKNFTNAIPCTKVKTVMSDRGKCYMFQNVGEQLVPGKVGGVVINLARPNNSFYEMYPKLATEMNIIGDFSVSMEKTIKNQISHRSYIIPINVTAKITLNPKHYIRCASEQQCNDSENFHSSDHCFFSCYIQATKQLRNCVPPGYWDEDAVDPDTAACHPFTTSDVYEKREERPHQACQKNCLPKCDEWVYESTISYSFLDSTFVNRPKSYVLIAYNTLQYIEVYTLMNFQKVFLVTTLRCITDERS